MNSYQKPGIDYFYIMVTIFLLTSSFTIFQQLHSRGLGLPLLFFLTVAFSFRNHPYIRVFIFIVIIQSVADSVLCYPYFFQPASGMKMPSLIISAMQVLIFGLITGLRLYHLANVLRMLRDLIAGINCHFTIMPLLFLGVASARNFPNEVAVRIILNGSSFFLGSQLTKCRLRLHNPIRKGVIKKGVYYIS